MTGRLHSSRPVGRQSAETGSLLGAGSLDDWVILAGDLRHVVIVAEARTLPMEARMKSTATKGPKHIDWQVTYACQLRCTHCYTESGRRASRKLPRADLLRIADKILALNVKRVLLGGGEPLLVPEIFEIVARLTAGKVPVSFYTNGLDLTVEQAVRLADLGAQVHVSIDGATPEVNDPIRGRAGAFAAAVESLGILNAVAAEQKRLGRSRFRFGIDVTLVQSNFAQIEMFCTALAPQFSEIAFIQLGAVIPSGLAAEASFARHEVLNEDQLQLLASQEFGNELRKKAPSSLEYICLSDNVALQLHSERAREMPLHYAEVMEIEPDGDVRAMVTYEGVVGNILRDSAEELWQRCQARAHHPVVVEELRGVKNSQDWAAAVRRLDEFFGTPADLVRFGRRPPYAPGPAAPPTAG
jgi:MoaA/NifB/PqqE/SkfB family radical SAM enzyme